MYEMFASNNGCFDIYTSKDEKITNIRKARENKEVMIGSFLDIDKIKQICEESDLQFQNRAILTSFGIVRL